LELDLMFGWLVVMHMHLYIKTMLSFVFAWGLQGVLMSK